jgi:shikimate kinase
MKIFLVGYMGSGKSTAGKRLAETLGLAFADLDEYIEKETGRSIGEIFEKDGEERFREMENNALKHFLDVDDIVISVGGGTPCFYDNMELMNRNGVTVYLKMSADSLAERLVKAEHKRPLIKDMSEFDLKNFITTNLEKREPFYLQAQYKVKGKNLDVNELAEFIRKETRF